MSGLLDTFKFPLAGSTDPYFANVVLLLHGEGSNASTTFTDSSSLARTVAPSGNAQISTAQYKFGTASMKFDGSGDYISTSSSADFDISGNWAIELWYRPATLGSVYRLVCIEQASTGWTITAHFGSIFWERLGFAASITTSSALTAGVWCFIQIVKSGTTTTLYVDGVSKGTTTTVPGSGNNTLRVGASVNNYPTANLDGFVDDLRFTTLARANAVPTAQFPDS